MLRNNSYTTTADLAGLGGIPALCRPICLVLQVRRLRLRSCEGADEPFI